MTTRQRVRTDEALSLAGLTKTYESGGGRVIALRGVSVTLRAGSFTAVMGPSGSGKSTLLQCAAGLDEPTGGEVRIAGQPVPHGDEGAVTRFRREHIGFVFQQYNLVPHLSVRQNVLLPMRFAGRSADRQTVATVLERLGLAGLADRLPAELSGGQQQRVAIARALVSRPAVLFADEPTGALDSASGREVLGLLRGAVDAFGQTVVMVTHDPVAAAHADEVLYLADGAIVDRQLHPGAETVAARMTQLSTAVGV